MKIGINNINVFFIASVDIENVFEIEISIFNKFNNIKNSNFPIIAPAIIPTNRLITAIINVSIESTLEICFFSIPKTL